MLKYLHRKRDAGVQGSMPTADAYRPTTNLSSNGLTCNPMMPTAVAFHPVKP